MLPFEAAVVVIEVMSPSRPYPAVVGGSTNVRLFASTSNEALVPPLTVAELVLVRARVFWRGAL